MLRNVVSGYNTSDDDTIALAPNKIHAHGSKNKSNEEMKDIIYHLFVSIIEKFHGNDIILHHLLPTLLFVQGTMKNFKN